MQEKSELNLNNPIFAVYINVDGLSRQRAEESISNVVKTTNTNSNVTMWYFGVQNGQETRVECIYDGYARDRDTEIFDLIKEINTRVDILSESKNFDDFKLKIRDWRLETVLVDGNNEK